MKIIIKISKILFILFILLFCSVFLIALFPLNSDNKICRENSEINVNNYLNINNIKEINFIRNCDKIIFYIVLDDDVNVININDVINEIINIKIINDDYLSFEVFVKNNNFEGIIVINKDESYDIVLNSN